MNPSDPPAHGPIRSDRPALSEQAQVDFFDGVWRAAEAATRATAPVTRDFAIAGGVLRLRGAGAASGVMMRALAHLALEAPARPDAEIIVFDTAGSGCSPPRAPCARDCFTDRGDIWGMASARIRSAFHLGEFSLNVFDHARQRGVFWVKDFAAVPYWSAAAPMRTLLHWWLSARGLQLMHGAAVGTDDGAVLIVGPGGAGKSTSAIASLAAGLRFAGDDYVALGLGEQPAAYSLYGTAKLVAEQVERFRARFGHAIEASGHDKDVLWLWPEFATSLARELPLRAIVTPSFGDGVHTRFEPIDPLRVENAAAFTTISQLPHAGEHTVSFVRRLAAALPCFEMRLGRDPSQVPAAIASLLRSDACRPGREARADVPAATDAGNRADARADTHEAPALAVVIPTYNGNAFLAQAIANAAAQARATCRAAFAHERFEIVVVDDGSSEDPGPIVAASDAPVRLVRQRNAGPAAARNAGVRACRAELIAFLDVDDSWTTGALALIAGTLLAQPACDVAKGHAQLLELDREHGTYHEVGNPGESFPFSISGTLFRRAAFERAGGFDESLRFEEDGEWFVRARDRGVRTVTVSAVTLQVRRHGANMTYGRSLVERNGLRLLKVTLDRRRAQQAAPSPPSPSPSPSPMPMPSPMPIPPPPHDPTR